MLQNREDEAEIAGETWPDEERAPNAGRLDGSHALAHPAYALAHAEYALAHVGYALAHVARRD
ncbi:MAG TPA: hypothetical protein VGR66_07225 [Candidatus Eisenbacteria bacterium]|jgi:hypothetical protein|nr:hypothetical protein [Candidatus Eisenbacteria bacterium]